MPPLPISLANASPSPKAKAVKAEHKNERAQANVAKQGRPTKFTQAIADEIAERLGNGEPLAQICRDDHMPGLTTVYDWQNARDEFSASIARAREAGYDHIAVDALGILDEQPERVVTVTGDDRSESRIDSASVQRAKNRFEGRLKLLAKWDARRYGYKLDLTTDGKALGLAAELEAARKRVAE